MKTTDVKYVFGTFFSFGVSRHEKEKDENWCDLGFSVGLYGADEWFIFYFFLKIVKNKYSLNNYEVKLEITLYETWDQIL